MKVQLNIFINGKCPTYVEIPVCQIYFENWYYSITYTCIYSMSKPICLKNSHFSYILMTILLVLEGIETNPGPVKLNNIKRVRNNVCSLPPKVDLVECELGDHDIIAISETHLDNTISDDSISIAGFHKPIRLDRNGAGGGVVIYVKKNLYFENIPDLINPEIELLWVKVSNKQTQFYWVYFIDLQKFTC